MDPLLRERIEAFLTAGHPGILSCVGPQGVLSLPVQYRVKGLALTCALPCWSDLAYLTEADPAVTLLLLCKSNQGDYSWLQYWGEAGPLGVEPWAGFAPSLPKGLRPADLFRFLPLQPIRIELVRGAPGQTIRETFDL